MLDVFFKEYGNMLTAEGKGRDITVKFSDTATEEFKALIADCNGNRDLNAWVMTLCYRLLRDMSTCISTNDLGNRSYSIIYRNVDNDINSLQTWLDNGHHKYMIEAEEIGYVNPSATIGAKLSAGQLRQVNDIFHKLKKFIKNKISN